MKCILSLSCFLCTLLSHAQHDKWRYQLFFSPAIGKAVTQKVLVGAGSPVRQPTINIGYVYNGGGTGIGYQLNNTLLLGCSFSLVQKAEHFEEFYGNSGSSSQVRNGFVLDELVFFQASFFAEKFFAARKGKWDWMIRGGVFRASEAGIPPPEVPYRQNDFGILLGAGIETQGFFTALEYQQGFVKTTKWKDPFPTTSIVSLNFGFNIRW